MRRSKKQKKAGVGAALGGAIGELTRPCLPQLLLLTVFFIGGALLGVYASKNAELSYKLGLYTTADSHLFGSFYDLMLDAIKLYALGFALSLSLLAAGGLPLVIGWYGFCLSYSTALYFAGRGAIPWVAVTTLIPKIGIAAPLFLFFCAHGTYFSTEMIKQLGHSEHGVAFHKRLLLLLIVLTICFSITILTCYIESLLYSLY